MIVEALQNGSLSEPIRYYQAYAEYWFVPVLVAVTLTGGLCFVLCTLAIASQLIDHRDFERSSFPVQRHHILMADSIGRSTSQESRSWLMIIQVIIFILIIAGAIISIVGNARTNQGANELSNAIERGIQRVSSDFNRFISNIETVTSNSPLNQAKVIHQRFKLSSIKNTLNRYSRSLDKGLASVIAYLNMANEVRSIVSWVVLSLVFVLSCMGLCGAFGSWSDYSLWMMFLSMIFAIMFVFTLGTSAFSLYVVDTACKDINMFLSGQSMKMSQEGQEMMRSTKLYAILQCDALAIVPQTIGSLTSVSKEEICTAYDNITCIHQNETCLGRPTCLDDLALHGPEAALRWELNDTLLHCNTSGVQTVVDDPRFCTEGDVTVAGSTMTNVRECARTCSNMIQKLKSQSILHLVTASKFFADRQVEADQLYSCGELNSLITNVYRPLCTTLRDGLSLLVAGSTMLLVANIVSAVVDGILWANTRL